MTVAVSTAAPAQSETKPETANPVHPVRRNKDNNEWCISDHERWHFVRGFQQGMLVIVKLVGEALRMECVKGYDSTGEAIGEVHETSRPPVMPADAVRQSALTYDVKSRTFHLAHDVDKEPVVYADYLLLYKDGSALAGWKE